MSTRCDGVVRGDFNSRTVFNSLTPCCDVIVVYLWIVIIMTSVATVRMTSPKVGDKMWMQNFISKFGKKKKNGRKVSRIGTV